MAPTEDGTERRHGKTESTERWRRRTAAINEAQIGREGRNAARKDGAKGRQLQSEHTSATKRGGGRPPRQGGRREETRAPRQACRTCLLRPRRCRRRCAKRQRPAQGLSAVGRIWSGGCLGVCEETGLACLRRESNPRAAAAATVVHEPGCISDAAQKERAGALMVHCGATARTSSMRTTPMWRGCCGRRGTRLKEKDRGSRARLSMKKRR